MDPEIRCPDEQVFSVYLDEELAPALRSRIERHLQGCPACRNTLGRLVELRRSLQADLEPSSRGSYEALRQILSYRKSLYVPRANLWRKRIALPVPAAVATVLLIAALGAFLLLGHNPSDNRKMSIRRGPTGNTEVQVTAPIEDLELLLKSLDKQAASHEIIITLPREPHFILMGEPKILKAADFQRSRP